jgi:AraC-like DNA-binding protein/quercetin dioxygenase-like cupin family protein
MTEWSDVDADRSVQIIEGEAGTATVAHWEWHRSWRWDAHSHDPHQLIWIPRGAGQIETEELDWVLPPTMGLWIPGGIEHSIGGADPAQIYLLYFEPDQCPIKWPHATAVTITPLIRELIVHLADPALTGEPRHRAERVLFDGLAPVSMITLHIPMPEDARARKVADGILANPADQRDLAQWAREVGAGVRTLTRIFSEETQMAFTQWRLHVRMRAAMQLLAGGTSVTTTARRVGYRSPSAFVQAFQRVAGTTPANYASTAQRPEPSASP